jgi:ABC-type multidrug transport system permease subunit
MNHPLCQLILARVREFTREPEAMFWTYGFPLAMAIALGIAFRERPVERVSVDVAQESAEIAMHLREIKSLKVEVHPSQECLERLRTGKTDVVLNETNNRYTFHYDQAKPTSVLARNTVNDALQRYAGRADPKVAVDVILKKPGGRYIDFLVPGLLGMSLMGGGMWGVGFVTVDMRIRKLLKRFLATPMKRSHFLIAVMVSRMLFMVPEVLLLLIFARLVFGVVIYGNLLALVALILLGALMFSGIGLLMATRAQTLETISGLMNLFMLPMWITSGIFFSVDRFPDAVQPYLRILPLTPLIDAIRSVMLEGTTLSSLGWELGSMLIWSVVSFALALKFFRWG